jgi:steroid 5-alpha reductase family enzyme
VSVVFSSSDGPQSRPTNYLADIAVFLGPPAVGARRAKQRWLPVLTGAVILLALVLIVVGSGAPLVRVAIGCSLAPLAVTTWIWWRNVRRARRYLVNRSAGAA